MKRLATSGGIAPALRGGATLASGIAPALRGGATLAACLLALGACEFDRADEEPMVQLNSCSVATDCMGGAQCMGGLCVAPEAAAAELEIALQVTPLPVRDSDTPHPVLIDSLKVRGGPLPGKVELPLPLTISGLIRNGDVALDASLTFTPMRVLDGIPAATVTVSTMRGSTNASSDYSVQLSAGREYSLLVRPVDTSLPPWRTTFKASAGEQPVVDYAQLETYTQTFLLNAPTDRVLLVRAFDAANQPISSTAKVEALLPSITRVVTGKATVVFAPDTTPARLEIFAEQSYAPMNSGTMAEGAFCDDDTPVYPVYSVSIAADDLPEPDASGAFTILLPEPAQRIRYEGTIALCPVGKTAMMAKDAPVVNELPVTLQSKNLITADPKFSASFDARTTAQRDPLTGEYTFCVQLLEGDYDVVVTPPTNLPCGLYAQRLTVDSPDGVAARGMLLELPNSASLEGTLQTVDEMPLAGATVDAVALGRAFDLDGGMTMSTTLTRYNRSRQATTSERGEFVVPVDPGSYDVVIKPPASSGFSWQVLHDVEVGEAKHPFARDVEMRSPVMLSGRLEYLGGSTKQQLALAGAEVLAFAVIGDQAVPGGDVVAERAIPIGKVMADADGAFMLLLPQAIEEWGGR